jgi:hypothetical protein
MNTSKVDTDASIGRAQLAERMRRMIRGVTTANREDTQTQPVSNETLPFLPHSDSNDTLPSSNETLPLSNDTLSINASAEPNKNALESNDSLPSNVSFSNDSLPSNESLPTENSNETLPNNESLLKKEEFIGNNSLPSNNLAAKIPKSHSNETLPSNDLLPYWSDSSPYGEPISENLFLLVLDAGMVELQSCLQGDTESVSMLFYWLLTRQRRSILYLTYAQMVEKFKYTRPKLSRALDKLREHPLFSVNTSHRGVFINIRKLIERVKITYPQFDLDSSNDSLPQVSSSKRTYIYENTTTTTTRDGVYQTLLKLSDSEFFVLIDVIIFYGFGPKEISQKVTEVIAEIYKTHGLEKIAFNLAYASGNKKMTSPIAYLLKTFHEDYGTASLSLEAREKAQNVIEVFQIARGKNLDDYSATDLRRFLFVLDKPIPDGSSRMQCLNAINDILSRASELQQKISQIIGRVEKKELPFNLTRLLNN